MYTTALEDDGGSRGDNGGRIPCSTWKVSCAEQNSSRGGGRERAAGGGFVQCRDTRAHVTPTAVPSLRQSRLSLVQTARNGWSYHSFSKLSSCELETKTAKFTKLVFPPPQKNKQTFPSMCVPLAVFKVPHISTLLLPKVEAKSCGVSTAAGEARASELGGRRCSALWMGKAAKDAEAVLKRFDEYPP